MRRILITPGYVRKKDLIERINEVREARQTAIEDDEDEDDVEFDEDVASVASQSFSQNGGSNCSREESTDTRRLRLQLEVARSEERVQAEREMMRERVELGFQGEEMRGAGAFAAVSA